MEILAVYIIEYPKYNVKQQKNYVDHRRFLEIKEGMNDEENPLPKDSLTKTFGENFFTSESPLANALLNNKLTLPINQGGEHDVKFTKL